MSLIQLENKYLFLEISPEMGASITRFLDKKLKQNIFRPFPNRKKIKNKNCYFSGYFLTVPYFGVIHKNTFLYKDKYISLARTHPLEPDTIHGEGWINKWKIEKKSKASINVSFTHSGKNSFPHKYQVYQKFSLYKKSLKISVKLINLDQMSFYCGIGFHPWFNISDKSKIFSNSFSYIKKIKNKYIAKQLTKKKSLDLNKFKVDSTFINWNGKSKLILSDDIKIEIINRKNINNLHVYSPPKENFFCIEPVTNIVDSFKITKYSNQYTGLKKIEKNKKFEASVEFRLIN